MPKSFHQQAEDHFVFADEAKVSVDDPLAIRRLRLALGLMYRDTGLAPGQPVIILCIGTDRSTGDALGPLIGARLKDEPLADIHVYGTLELPVHASNLTQTIDELCVRHPNAFIIAVDACLGRTESVGVINVGKGPLKPGAGVNKNLPPIGNIYITGIVNVGGFMEYFVLQNTRLSLVMKLAKIIADAIAWSIRDLFAGNAPELTQV